MSNDMEKKARTILLISIIAVSVTATVLLLVQHTDDPRVILREEFIPGDWEWSFPIPQHSKIKVILSQGVNWSEGTYYWDIVNKFTVTVGEEEQVASITLSKFSIIDNFIYHNLDTLTFNDTGDATELHIIYGMEDWYSIPEEHHLPNLELRLTIVLEETWT